MGELETSTKGEINIQKIILEVFPDINKSGLKISDIVNQILSNLKNSEITEENVRTQINITVNKSKEVLEN